MNYKKHIYFFNLVEIMSNACKKIFPNKIFESFKMHIWLPCKRKFISIRQHFSQLHHINYTQYPRGVTFTILSSPPEGLN